MSKLSYSEEKDPMEAIYALNIGDFIAESFISDDLLNKIADRIGKEPDKLRKQLEELVEIYSMENTLGILGFDTNKEFILYDSIASTLCEMFQVDGCQLFQMVHKQTGEDQLSLTGTSLDRSVLGNWEGTLSLKDKNLLSEALQSSKVVTVDTLGPAQAYPLKDRHPLAINSLLIMPLYEGRKCLGCLVLESVETRSYMTEVQELAHATAKVFVTSIRLQALLSETQDKLDQALGNANELMSLRAQITERIADLGIHQQEFVEALGNAVDARHHFTRGHSKHVAQIAQALAEEMGLNEKTMDLIYYAGLLGSLGKIHLSPDVLAKKEGLNPQEWEALRNHPNMGVNLLMRINFLSEVIPYIQSQQERWDGSGGPEGLAGQSIPLGARILAVSDAYHSMTRERPYREAPLSHLEALAKLQEEAGSKWDPAVVRALLNIPEASLA